MNGNGVHELVLLDQAKQALSEARSFDQIKDIRDKAEAVRKYAQSASLGLDIQNRAAEVKLRAERQAGKLLAQLMLRGGDRRSKLRHARLKLDDLGISRNQSTRWQIEAKVPENVFCQYVRETCDAGKEITSANLMRIAKQCGSGANSQNGHGSNGHHQNSHGATDLGRFRHRLDHARAESFETVVSELTNHHQILSGVLEPVIKSENGIHLKIAERRILQYLLGEIGQLVEQLQNLQAASGRCACGSDAKLW
jgi:hypothetical protein